MSFVGGYPVGANTIASLVREKKLSQETAARMLCFSAQRRSLLFDRHRGGGAAGAAPGWGGFSFLPNCVRLPHWGDRLPPGKNLPGETGGVGLPFSAAFVEAVSGAASGMFGLCAFITAFSGILALLRSSGVLSGIACLLAKIAPSSLADPNLFEALLGWPAGSDERLRGRRRTQGGSPLCGDQPAHLLLRRVGHLPGGLLPAGSGVRLSPFVLSRFAHAFLTSAIAYPLYLKWGREVMTALGTAARLSLEVSPTSVLRALCILAMCAILLLTASTAPLQAKK